MTVEELRQIIRNLPPLPDTSPEFTWLNRRIGLRRHILSENPLELEKWSTINALIRPGYQEYHLCQWERVTGLSVADLGNIVEFGGGYGEMAALCHQRGFRGSYYSVDFPEMLVLQSFYLSRLGLPDALPLSINHCDLLIAICSLSETDRKTRDEFLSRLAFDHCLICYYPDQDGLSNHKYFEDFGELIEGDDGLDHYYRLR